MLKKSINAKALGLKFPYLTILLTVLPVWLCFWGAVRSASSSEPDLSYVAGQFLMAGMFSLTTLLILAGWASRLVDEVKNLKSTIWELEAKVSRLKSELAQTDKSPT
jgi:hypothetical protein